MLKKKTGVVSVMLKQVSFSAGTGKFLVRLSATITGNGLVVQLMGGEEPHVGAVVLSVPRPSLAMPGILSCNSFVLPLIGHKDDEIAKPVAEKIAVNCGSAVVVIAGIHIEDATGEDIGRLTENCWRTVHLLLDEIGEITPDKKNNADEFRLF